jgi:hypothetical protein
MGPLAPKEGAFASEVDRMRHRPRREIPRPLAHVLGATLFRYSPGRRAYVLRLIGGRWGPVLRIQH